MNVQSEPFSEPPLVWYLRVFLAGMAIAMITLLYTASQLDPDPSGQGTHQQLGLPPCTFVSLYEMRCPSCGMTTSWSHLTHGDLYSALMANTGGTLLALCSIVGAPWLLYTSIVGHPPTPFPNDFQLAIGALTIGIVTVVDWVVRISIG